MKRVILFILLLCLMAISYGQLAYTTMGVQTEVVASDTLSFAKTINSGYELTVAVGFEINTVNTSDFEGSFYIDKSFINSSWVSVMAYEDYTFTQTADDNETILIFEESDWVTPKIRVRIETSADAQSILITPWIQTTRLR